MFNLVSNQEEKVWKIDEPKDNRALVDNNTAQSLTGDEIDAMRRYNFFQGLHQMQLVFFNICVFVP